MGAVRRRVAGAARARGSPAGRMGQAPGGSQVAGACRQRVQGRVAGVRAPRGRVAGLVAGSPFPPTLRPIPTGSGLRARVARRWSRARVAVVRIASGGRGRRSRPRIARGGRGRGRGRGSRSRGSRAGPQTIASHCIARVPGHRLDPLTNPHPRSHQNPSRFHSRELFLEMHSCSPSNICRMWPTTAGSRLLPQEPGWRSGCLLNFSGLFTKRRFVEKALAFFDF